MSAKRKNPSGKVTDALMRAKEKVEKVGVAMKTGAKPGDAPKFLGQVGKTAWENIVRDLDAMGCLDRADTYSILLAAAAFEEYSEARDILADHKGPTYETFNKDGELLIKKHPAAEIAASAWQRMRSLLPDLYLTPLSRLKSAPKGTGGGSSDPFEAFLTGKS